MAVHGISMHSASLGHITHMMAVVPTERRGRPGQPEPEPVKDLRLLILLRTLLLRTLCLSRMSVTIKWSMIFSTEGISVVTKNTEKMAPRPTRCPTSRIAGLVEIKNTT